MNSEKAGKGNKNNFLGFGLLFQEFYKMQYRKFAADEIFDGFKFLEKQQVLITDKEGVIREIIHAADAGDDIQMHHGILSPAFINCHCHLELSHMKGLIPEATGLVNFVLEVMKQRHFPDEEILAAIAKGEEEMLANGIIAVGDICNNVFTLGQKTQGRLYYQNFVEASGFTASIAAQRFERSADFFKQFGEEYEIPAESNSIVPHAPYSVATELWEKIIHFPGNHLFTIHNQEMPAENEWFISKTGELTKLYETLKIDTSAFIATGKSSLQSYLLKFLRHQQLILVHNVCTSEEDILFSKTNGRNILYWCLCPNANSYISRKSPPVELLRKHECKIVIGTDSLASNHQLSVLEELKTLHRDFPSIPVDELLRWGTSNGAQALQLSSIVGNFEKGKKPGVVVVQDDLSAATRII